MGCVHVCAYVNQTRINLDDELDRVALEQMRASFRAILLKYVHPDKNTPNS
jgi:hypothetical protein